MYSERRTDVAFFAVIVTPGLTTNVNMTTFEASEGRRVGISFLTVAADYWVDRYVLSSISSYPYEHNTIIAANYSTLTTPAYVRIIADTICNSQLQSFVL